MCETCACVIHTNLYTLSALVLSPYIKCLRGVHVLHEALVSVSTISAVSLCLKNIVVYQLQFYLHWHQLAILCMYLVGFMLVCKCMPLQVFDHAHTSLKVQPSMMFASNCSINERH